MGKSPTALVRLMIFIVMVIVDLAICFVVFEVASGNITLMKDCNKRETEIPSVSVYPNSVLLYMEDLTRGSQSGRLYYRYETPDSSENVLGFYKEIASCWIETKICEGKADPYGEYFVYVRNNGNKTYLDIDVGWDKCSPSGLRINIGD